MFAIFGTHTMMFFFDFILLRKTAQPNNKKIPFRLLFFIRCGRLFYFPPLPEHHLGARPLARAGRGHHCLASHRPLGPTGDGAAVGFPRRRPQEAIAGLPPPFCAPQPCSGFALRFPTSTSSFFCLHSTNGAVPSARTPGLERPPLTGDTRRGGACGLRASKVIVGLKYVMFVSVITLPTL